MKQLIDMFLPNAIKNYYYQKGKRDAFNGKAVFCPVCEKNFITFLPFGVRKRANAQCPGCYSLERHRLMWMYLNSETDIMSGQGKRMLHVAPEVQFFNIFSGTSTIEYFPGAKYDLEFPDEYPAGTKNLDITDIAYDDNFFDVIYCSHVLEHVPDDAKAMDEFYRVLKPKGWAILQVPIDNNLLTTYEDATITSPEERIKHFGQRDHVRSYGRDYKSRLENSGFKVTVVDYLSRFSEEEKFKYGLPHAEDIYYCEKELP